MRYKVGDRVFIKPWKLMEKDCGLDVYGKIKHKKIFISSMERILIGRNRIAKILSVSDDCYGVQLDGEEREWRYAILDDMIAGYAFDYDKKAEFSDNRRDWYMLSFRGFAPGTEYPYSTGMYAPSYKWRYARPLSKESEIEINVKINGKEAKLSNVSDETLRNIKEKEKSELTLER